MQSVYSVAQINLYIKNMFLQDYLLKNIQIKGELSNVKYHSSGHIYFSLKEDDNVIHGVMFRSYRLSNLDFDLENGQSVIITGSIVAYERDGKYQIYAKEIALEGIGDLYEEYERLKNKLYEEGLFEFEHKKEIPAYPKKVGIVTAQTGAAIQDIQNIAKRRNPYVQLYLYPAKVQGKGAAKTIVEGIQILDTMGLDTIIIGRGGGSIEDLWPFNEECVAWAIFNAKTPIISGTGHEIDNTIADYVADLRAPTPSAACELAIPDIMGMVRQVEQYEKEMNHGMYQRILHAKQRTEMLSAKLERSSPIAKFERQCTKYNILLSGLQQSIERKYKEYLHQYELLLTKVNSLSPTEKLIGGYGYLERSDGKIIKSVKDVKEQDCFKVTVCDGTIEGCVTKIEKNGENKHE